VQIRTREMHRDAELGVAAHWRYKERAKRATGKGDPFDEKIAWLRQMLAWRDEIVDARTGSSSPSTLCSTTPSTCSRPRVRSSTCRRGRRP